MPHICVLFIEDAGVKKLLREKKTVIREIVAEHTGYALEEIALFPQMLPRDLYDLTDNVLALELIIDAGTRCKGDSKETAAAIKDALKLRISNFDNANFGVWLRKHADNGYAENRTVMPKFYEGDPCSPDDPG